MKKGLTSRQVVENREKFGTNKLPEKKMKTGLIVSRPQNNPQPFMYCINRLFLSADTFPLTKRNSPK